MVTTTTVYGFQKPAVAGDEDAWGGYLNNNIDKYESILTGNTTITNVVITTADINGGTLDNVVIGGSTAAAISGTTITGTSLVGPLATAAQPNITSLGTLTTLTVDDITINGSTISDGGTLTIDAAGEINLDADTGGAVRLMDASVNYGTFYSSSSDFVILSQAQDKDIIFQGNDGGSSIEAMRIDMSAGGYLGIGTASPSQLIELRNTSGSFGAEATIRGSTSAGAPKAEIAFKRESSGDDTSIVFRPSDNGTLNATAMTLNHNGNLGIGVSAPDQPLQVKGIIEAQATNSTNGWMLYTYTDNTFRVNYNGSGSDEITIDTSGNMTVTGSLTVDDITIDGSTISDGADLTIDVGGVLNLDAGTQIVLKDDGTTYGTFYQSSSDFYIQSLTQDKDIVFYGSDGGSGVAALTLDMSDAGTAIFNHDIKLGPSGGDVFIYYNSAKWLSTPSNAKYLSIGDSGSNPWDGNTGTRLMFGSADSNAIAGYYIGTNLENYNGNYNKLDIDYATGIRIKANRTYGGTRFYDSTNDGLLLSVGVGNTDVEVANSLIIPSNLQHAGDSDTMLQFSDANTIRLVAGNTETFKTTASAITISVDTDIDGDLNAVDNIYVADKIYHEGDTNTYISFGTDSVQTYAGGTATWSVYSSYVAVQGYMYNYYTYYDESTQLTGTTPTINAANSGNFYLTMSGNTTFTFSDTQTGGSWAHGFTLYLTGNGSTVTWPNDVNWAGGTAPDAPANGEVDVYVFHTRDGANWYGALAIDAAS